MRMFTSRISMKTPTFTLFGKVSLTKRRESGTNLQSMKEQIKESPKIEIQNSTKARKVTKYERTNKQRAG